MTLFPLKHGIKKLRVQTLVSKVVIFFLHSSSGNVLRCVF